MTLFPPVGYWKIAKLNAVLYWNGSVYSLPEYSAQVLFYPTQPDGWCLGDDVGAQFRLSPDFVPLDAGLHWTSSVQYLFFPDLTVVRWPILMSKLRCLATVWDANIYSGSKTLTLSPVLWRNMRDLNPRTASLPPISFQDCPLEPLG